ncbi:class I SAM-dependent methyltransferase [Streptomyces sp. NPDC101118]|uniref:class I SAM-dependent methyltransferase n=1 Tax=Streptomyces sp. NPDC101118 TaxID=3366109 RepID=UPI00380DFBED
MTTARRRMAAAFDGLAEAYDDAHHDGIARALVGWLAPGGGEAVADVACGTGAVALAVVAAGGGEVPVLAVDLSAGMVAAGRARGERAGVGGAVDWRVGPAVPLPVADGALDVVLCASSLHFLGAAALDDWLRAVRPGGRVGFTLPVASRFRPGGVFAELVAGDLGLPETAEDGCRLAAAAGFAGPAGRLLSVGDRAVVMVRARVP